MVLVCSDQELCLCRCTPSPWGPPGWWPVPTLPLATTWPVEAWTTSAPSTTWKPGRAMCEWAGSCRDTQVSCAPASPAAYCTGEQPCLGLALLVLWLWARTWMLLLHFNLQSLLLGQPLHNCFVFRILVLLSLPRWQPNCHQLRRHHLVSFWALLAFPHPLFLPFIFFFLSSALICI